MQQKSVDLSSLFTEAARELAANQQTINQADAYNGDHGSNMAQTFQTISSALEKKKGSSASTALNYAAKQVGRSTHSGSGQMYAENLARAATQFKGRQVDQRGALDLLMTLIGGGQGGTAPAKPQAHPAQSSGTDEMLGALLGGNGAPQTNQASGAGGDLLGTLLGGMGGQTGGQTPAQGGDMLSSLLGGLTGAQGGTTSQSGGQPGLDMGDLLNAGMAFMQAKQSGGNTTQALMQAFMAGSGMGRSPHREQSTELVVNSFLQALAKGG